ncbi:uncharacterized protein LOC136024744 [Artemia franciscana]|uniref:uncharacterized protein LOC136024744 n=1 Tax=Artemia franciscana TaxID=6661 RepID=UPI0032DA8763
MILNSAHAILGWPEKCKMVTKSLDSNLTRVANILDYLKNEEKFTDVTIVAAGSSVPCHRVYLSAISPFFQKLFSDVPVWEKEVCISIPDIEFEDLKLALGLIYQGEICVDFSKITKVLELAKLLELPICKKESRSFLPSNAGSSNRKESPVFNRRSNDVTPVAYCSTYEDFNSQTAQDTGAKRRTPTNTDPLEATEIPVILPWDESVVSMSPFDDESQVKSESSSSGLEIIDDEVMEDSGTMPNIKSLKLSIINHDGNIDGGVVTVGNYMELKNKVQEKFETPDNVYIYMTDGVKPLMMIGDEFGFSVLKSGDSVCVSEFQCFDISTSLHQLVSIVDTYPAADSISGDVKDPTTSSRAKYKFKVSNFPDISRALKGDTFHRSEKQRIASIVYYKLLHFNKVEKGARRLDDSDIVAICKELVTEYPSLLDRSEDGKVIGQGYETMMEAMFNRRDTPIRPKEKPREKFKASLQFMTSQKNKEVLSYCGYLYNLHQIYADGRSRWRCRERTICSATIVINREEQTVYKEPNHSHSPNLRLSKRMLSL